MKGFDEYYDEAVTGLHRRNKAGLKRRGARKMANGILTPPPHPHQGRCER